MSSLWVQRPGLLTPLVDVVPLPAYSTLRECACEKRQLHHRQLPGPWDSSRPLDWVAETYKLVDGPSCETAVARKVAHAAQFNSRLFLVAPYLHGIVSIKSDDAAVKEPTPMYTIFILARVLEGLHGRAE